MAIIDIVEHRVPDIDFDQLTATREFRVEFDAIVEDPAISGKPDYIEMAYQATWADLSGSGGIRIPRKGDVLRGTAPVLDAEETEDSPSQSVVTSRVASLFEEQNLLWIVTVEYSVPETTELQKDDDPDRVFDRFPWTLPPEYSWGHFFEKRRIYRDQEGNAITNSFGDDFTQSIFTNISIRTVTATWNERMSGFRPLVANEFINSINQSGFTLNGTSIPKNKAKCVGYDGVTQTAVVNGNNIAYWRVTAVWHILTSEEDEWVGRVLDKGWNQRWDRDGEVIVDDIKDKNGRKPAAAPLLNGTGLRLFKRNGETHSEVGGGGGALAVDEVWSTDRYKFLKYFPYPEMNHSRIR
jgi:hypothetical protein